MMIFTPVKLMSFESINSLFQMNSDEQMSHPANELADFYLKVPLTK